MFDIDKQSEMGPGAEITSTCWVKGAKRTSASCDNNWQDAPVCSVTAQNLTELRVLNDQ